MISLIICSRTPDIDVELKKNISETIGSEYELIVIDNSTNQFSIFSAYNEGVRRSKGEFLCFMHDDILFHTEKWGKKITSHFLDKTIGLVGVAGTHYLPKVPTYWMSSPFLSQYSLNNDDGYQTECFHTGFFHEENIVDVVACDGMFFCMRKQLFDTIEFDEKIFTGFHFYDMDICMQVLNNNFRACVCNDVLIEHFWRQQYDMTIDNLFVKNQNIFFNKWEKYFPISRGIEVVPSDALMRLNGLYGAAYEAYKIKNSKAYKLGKFLLFPFKKFK